MYSQEDIDKTNEFHKENKTGIKYINVNGPDFSKPFNKEEIIKSLQKSLKYYNSKEK